MNCNEISNYSTQEQPFYGAAWLVLNILLELVLLLSSVSVYVAYEDIILQDEAAQHIHVFLKALLKKALVLAALL